MTAEIHAFPTSGSDGPAPLVPANVDVRGLPHVMSPCALYDGDWCGSATDAEWRAGMQLFRNSLEQVPGGTLPSSDILLARLADLGRDAEAFLKVKAKALEGWRLCSDGRYHRPEAAANALRMWLGKLVRRRHSAQMNQKQHPDKSFGLGEIDADLQAGVEAFALGDPQDATLRDVQAKMAKWKVRQPELSVINGDAACEAETNEPARGPSRGPARGPETGALKRNETSRSDVDSSSELCSEDSRPTLTQNEQEFVQGEILAPLGQVATPQRGPPGSWPSDAMAQLKAVYPKWKDAGDVEKALAALRKQGRVAFATILAGAERVRANNGDLTYVKYPARWLRARGWEDEPDPPPTHTLGPAPNRPAGGGLSAAYGAMRMIQHRSEQS